MTLYVRQSQRQVYRLAAILTAGVSVSLPRLPAALEYVPIPFQVPGMDVGRFTVKAAVTMGLRLRIVCTVCGNSRVFDAVSLDRQPPDMRLQALPLLCRTCLHRDVIISVDQPDLLRPADPHALSYHIEEWDEADQKITAIIGAVNNATIAQATFAAAVAEYPRKRIQLRQGCHLMRTHEPPRRVPGSDQSE